MPFIIFFFILFGVPYIELSLFVEVGAEVGVFKTILLCLLTAFFGLILIRHQGWDTYVKARQKMNQNILPEEEMLHGIALLFAGFLLLIPGFFTDTIGFLLLVPPLRLLLFQRILRSGSSHHFVFMHSAKEKRNSAESLNDPPTIEGEYHTLDDDKPK